MVAISQPDRFEIGDPVIFNSRVCVVQAVQNTHLGYKSYNIVDCETGKECNMSKHQLTKPKITECNMQDVNWDENLVFVELSDPVTGLTVQPTRHVQMNEDEIDQIAQSRLSANSEKQTKWVVNMLKGK